MATACRNYYPINGSNFIYIEGSHTPVEGYRRVIYIAKYVCLREAGENGGSGVALLDEIQAIAKHVYVDLMRKVEQAIDVPGSCIKVCPDFHIETSVAEQTSLQLDIFGPRSEPIIFNHEDMLKIFSFKDDLISTLDAPLSEHRCGCNTMNSFLFYKCSKKSIDKKEGDDGENIDDNAAA